MLLGIDDSTGYCVYTAHIRHPTVHNMFAIYHMVINTFFPTVVMFIAYSRMGYILYRSEFASKDKKQAQVNMFETCVLMMIMFTLSSLNTCISMMLFAVGYYPTLGSDYYNVSLMLLVLNHGVNPLIYSLRYKEFQAQFKHLFCTNSKNSSSESGSIATSMEEAKSVH